MTKSYRDKYLIDTDEAVPPGVLKDLDLAYEVSARVNQRVPCEGCGVCCHQKRITLNDNEPLRISSFLDMPEEEFCERYLIREDGRWFFRITDPCCFLDENDRCRIQSVKPEICGDAPFLTTHFIEAVLFLLRNQREGLTLPLLGTFVMDDSPCSRKAGSIVSEEIAMVLAREKDDARVDGLGDSVTGPV